MTIDIIWPDQAWYGCLLFLFSVAVMNASRTNVSPVGKWKRMSTGAPMKEYIPYSKDPLKDTVVVDCTHPSAYQITHHLKDKNRRKLMNLALRGDSSTDAVLNAITQHDTKFSRCKYVTCNHFDVDGFLSVWCAIYPDLAKEHEQLLRECARIGDFRELRLDEQWQYRALRLVCWLNSVERKEFYRPFESAITSAKGEEEGEDKFAYFLRHFGSALLDGNLQSAVEADSELEYQRVLSEYKELHLDTSDVQQKHAVQQYPLIGMTVVRMKEPGHYYSLFSPTRGSDIVLAIYSNNRYEVELKYTTYVDINSRPTFPRVDMHGLTTYLNSIESVTIQSQFRWCCDSITDGGPLLRLEPVAGPKLTKAERYGHPYERTIQSSSIHPILFERILHSYFAYAFYSQSHSSSTAIATATATATATIAATATATATATIAATAERRKDWNWSDLHAFNKQINWKNWQPPIDA